MAEISELDHFFLISVGTLVLLLQSGYAFLEAGAVRSKNAVNICLRYATHILQFLLQRQNAENLKQIFPEKEYRGLSPNFHYYVSAFYGSAFSAVGNMRTDPGNI
jgi:hypothetical protein